MSEHAEAEPRRLEINWVQAAGGALAAVSSALLLSTVGVAGTILGAAAGSVIVTVGNAVYSHYLAASKERVAAAAVVAREKAARSRGRIRPGATEATHGVTSRGGATEVDQVRDSQAAASEGSTWQEVVAGLPWKRLAVIALGIFGLAMAAILTFELITGRAVSAYTGGSDPDGPRTSFGGSADPRETKEPEPTGPTPESTSEPTEPEPSAEETTNLPEETETEPTTSAPTTAPETAEEPAATAEPTS